MKVDKEKVEEYSLKYMLYIEKAILYAECLNAVSRKKVVDLDGLYERSLEAQGIVLHGGKND